MNTLLREAFLRPQSRTYAAVNNFFAFLTIISIVSLVLETVPSFVKYDQFFLVVEWVAVILFSGEYIGRLVVAKPKWKYVVSFFGIIDLVSILPTFLGLGNFTFLKSARAFRIIRLLRMLRLAKVTRSGLVTDEGAGVLSLNILIYFATLVTALLITGTAMYLAEPNLSAFASIPAGMWWSLKVFMAGIPVAEPQTDIGWVFFVITRFVGLLLFGLLVGVVGNVFRSVMLGRR
ncbi:MAG: ion transporter [Candidatus Kaiserbacteria bacterium]|nr:ion transporter [Candidatus Kaiserbacteria bacterium]MCB9816482.1 ion transporter [Candidatus Nomurabacteria bacterium]